MSTWDAINAWLHTAYLVGAVIDWALFLLPGVAVTVTARCCWYAARRWLDRRADARVLLAAQAATTAPVAARIDTRPGTDTAALDTCQAIAAATRKETP